eukprot:9102834-Karenia_brevis.AAC.1
MASKKNVVHVVHTCHGVQEEDVHHLLQVPWFKPQGNLGVVIVPRKKWGMDPLDATRRIARRH